MAVVAQTPAPDIASKHTMLITQPQKQAIVDNLQLEITERARKLRVQYEEQAQALRSRLELRVNRVPLHLRGRNLQELIDEASRDKDTPMPQGKKRSSQAISSNADNDKDKDLHPLENPKKRQKAAVALNTEIVPIPRGNTPGAATSRAASPVRKPVPSTVLSPKSNNTRTLPIPSPTKPISPTKSVLPRSTSPIKAAAPKPTRPVSRQGKPLSKPASAEVNNVYTIQVDEPTRSTSTTRKKKPVTSTRSKPTAAIPTSTATTTSPTKRGIKSALASLTGSKRAAVATANKRLSGNNTSPQKSNVSSAANSISSMSSRVLRRRN